MDFSNRMKARDEEELSQLVKHVREHLSKEEAVKADAA